MQPNETHTESSNQTATDAEAGSSAEPGDHSAPTSRRIERLAVGPDGIPEISAAGPAFKDVPLPTPLVSVAPSSLRTVEALELMRSAIREIDVISGANDGAAPDIQLAEPCGDRREAGEAASSADADAVPMRWPFVERRSRPRSSERLERVVNVAIASIGLIVAAPIMLLVAIAVKLTSPGPILYTQVRVGRDTRTGRERRRHPFGERKDRRRQNVTGRPFTIYKFRSMRSDAEASSGAVWAQKGDARVTPLGRVLRVSRLDELPQLWNVLKGDMNIVGPRPERPTIIVNLVRDIREYPCRHRARPGITGWAQINAAYDSSIDDVRRKVHYDLVYLEQRSLAMDLRIMARTVPVMLFKKLGW